MEPLEYDGTFKAIEGNHQRLLGETAEDKQRIRELEKANRVLQKKLERSEEDRHQLEEVNEKKEFLLRQVIRELDESQKTLEQKGKELEAALANLQRMQTKLVESEKMSALGVLVAGVAHEINNPVNFIHANLTYAYDYTQALLRLIQLYQQQYPQPAIAIQEEIAAMDLDFLKEDFSNVLQSMNAGTIRIREIVKSLRTFSHHDQADGKAVDIHEGIDSTLMILQNRLKVKPNHPAIALIKDYGELPLVECYSGQLNQVFMNILANAIDALEESSQVSVLSSKLTENSTQNLKLKTQNSPTIHIHTQVIDTQHIQIRIADNGAGMTEATHQRLFDPFFTTKAVGKGMGLGLSISYQIVVENHGGKIYCHSAPGQGAAFLIELPIRQSAAEH